DSFISQQTTDGRGTGFSRQVDGPDVDTTATVDIGAYEMQTPLANLADTSTNEDTQLLVTFDGGDTSTITSVTATSSNATLVPNDVAHLSVAITGSTGIVTINPATNLNGNLNGTTDITVTVNRTAGSESKTFVLTVNPANDAPSFTRGADQIVNEDASTQTVANWATAISPGPADESAQALTFQVTGNTNAFLFAVAPAVDSAGTLTYTPGANASGLENITLTLSSPTGGAALGATASMSVTIADDATEPPTNIIDDAGMFVRMHYHDFLNREADQSGLDFWTSQITACGNDTACTEVRRINASAAFFVSIEFQQTGYLVDRMYKVGYGDATATSSLGGAHQVFVPVVRANEFLADTQRIGRGVIVLQPGWEQVLENNKHAYVLEFVQTARFISALPTTMTPTQFVDKLNQNAGNVLSPSERTTAINSFGIAANTTNVTARAQVLRQIAEDQDLYNAELNRAFVLSEYIGYVRRNPNDLPDSDYTGYEFWLSKLNQFNGDYIGAEMVKAFISAGEYRQRFGP
ncbi:MAG TPA: DUF4214 domain-containing protein, partial [Pyrinomonadaceae bacterium]